MTSLESLPNELKSVNKVSMAITEKNTKINNPIPKQNNINQTELSKESINQIVQGLQKASASNLTSLPTRDIPTTNQEITHDNTIQPDFIPETNTKDYINDTDTIDSLLIKNKSNQFEQDRLDILYEELQIPVLSMILYFFFQLPYFQKMIIINFPSLFLKDGNPNLYGYLFKTIVFGTSFYSINKFSKYLSEF
jgi:hypothetical protein